MDLSCRRLVALQLHEVERGIAHQPKRAEEVQPREAKFIAGKVATVSLQVGNLNFVFRDYISWHLLLVRRTRQPRAITKRSKPHVRSRGLKDLHFEICRFFPHCGLARL